MQRGREAATGPRGRPGNPFLVGLLLQTESCRVSLGKRAVTSTVSHNFVWGVDKVSDPRPGRRRPPLTAEVSWQPCTPPELQAAGWAGGAGSSPVAAVSGVSLLASREAQDTPLGQHGAQSHNTAARPDYFLSLVQSGKAKWRLFTEHTRRISRSNRIRESPQCLETHS